MRTLKSFVLAALVAFPFAADAAPKGPQTSKTPPAAVHAAPKARHAKKVRGNKVRHSITTSKKRPTTSKPAAPTPPAATPAK